MPSSSEICETMGENEEKGTTTRARQAEPERTRKDERGVSSWKDEKKGPSKILFRLIIFGSVYTVQTVSESTNRI